MPLSDRQPAEGFVDDMVETVRMFVYKQLNSESADSELHWSPFPFRHGEVQASGGPTSTP
ncbi:MAG: hypothetical protein ACI8U4_000602 [Natronomonas sp.]|jgi:hypothetical protein